MAQVDETDNDADAPDGELAQAAGTAKEKKQ